MPIVHFLEWLQITEEFILAHWKYFVFFFVCLCWNYRLEKLCSSCEEVKWYTLWIRELMCSCGESKVNYYILSGNELDLLWLDSAVLTARAQLYFEWVRLCMRHYLKAPEHEYMFSKYSQNLNISEIFWSCYTKNNFPIIFQKYKTSFSDVNRNLKFHVSNQTTLKLEDFSGVYLSTYLWHSFSRIIFYFSSSFV